MDRKWRTRKRPADGLANMASAEEIKTRPGIEDFKKKLGHAAAALAGFGAERIADRLGNAFGNALPCVLKRERFKISAANRAEERPIGKNDHLRAGLTRRGTRALGDRH